MSPSDQVSHATAWPTDPATANDPSGATCHEMDKAPQRAYDAVLALGRRAIVQPEADVLLEDAARLIAEVAGGDWALIGHWGHPVEQRLLGTVPHVEAPKTHAAVGYETLTGLALDQARPIIVPDMSTSEICRDPWLRKAGVRSALIVPLQLDNTKFGALGACCCEPVEFEVDALCVAETISHLVATTLAHYRSETMLHQQQQLTVTFYDTVDALVLVISPDGRVKTVNRACRELTGFEVDDFGDRPVWDVLAPADEGHLYRNAVARLLASESQSAQEATMMTKHGERRTVAWRFGIPPTEQGAPGALILTGVDVTEQRQAETQAERAKRALAEMQLELAEQRTPDRRQSASGSRGSGASADDTGAAASRERRTGVSDRRRKPRRPYPYQQNIAYIRDNNYPTASDFFEVRCCDIAAGGFSFYSPVPPKSKQLVVALGSPSHLTYLTSRVVHVTQVVRDGEIVHLVGCQYTGRAAD